MDPMLNFKATDRIRASVSEGENGGTRMVNFDVSIVVKNRLDNLSFAFDVAAPEDATIQNELTAMGAEERGKQALYIMLMKTYLGTGPIGGGGGGLGKLNMGSALNSVLSSQINSLMGNLKNASVSVGVEDHDASDTGGKRTDYSFRYSQRLFNNRNIVWTVREPVMSVCSTIRTMRVYSKGRLRKPESVWYFARNWISSVNCSSLRKRSKNERYTY